MTTEQPYLNEISARSYQEHQGKSAVKRKRQARRQDGRQRHWLCGRKRKNETQILVLKGITQLTTENLYVGLKIRGKKKARFLAQHFIQHIRVVSNAAAFFR